jgi:peptide deformylase
MKSRFSLGFPAERAQTMIRPIVQLGNPLLKARARVLDASELTNEDVQTLARDMLETLNDAGGVGLAAPQVGVSIRLILAGSFPTEQNPDRPLVPISVLVNPTIVWSSAETEPAWEGCLSFLQYRVRVTRAKAVRVACLRLDGRPEELDASGFFARVLQHEIDHLDGILTLDRAAAPEDVEKSESAS